ncbi:MAG: EamA family transporter [Pseudonocardiaceae bacterium]|nr:EamA family transporter [Pseudonocardiaceae bacterium]
MLTSSRSSLLLAAAGVLWGTGGLAGALLQEQAHLDPLAVAAYRLLLGGGLATAGYAVHGGLRQRWSLPMARRVLVVGSLLAIFQTAYYAAISQISVSLATLITIGSVPLFVAVATAARDRRWPRPTVVLTICVALAGLALLCGAPVAAGSPWSKAVGVSLSLCAGAGFATMTMINRPALAGLSSAAVTTFGLLTGGLLLLPFALPLGMGVPLSAGVLGTAVFLGAVPTAIAYGAYFAGLRHAQPVVAALSVLLEPLTATVLSVILLGDRLGVAGTLGAVLLCAALALNYLPARRERVLATR